MYVLCSESKYCPVDFCGGKKPHLYDSKECGKCPHCKTAKCNQVHICLECMAWSHEIVNNRMINFCATYQKETDIYKIACDDFESSIED